MSNNTTKAAAQKASDATKAAAMKAKEGMAPKKGKRYFGGEFETKFFI